MAIKHSVVKVPGQKLFAVTDWNADHTAEEDPVFTAWDKDHADLTNVLPNQHHTKYIHPVGAITMYGAAAAPTGWLLCNGAAVSRSTYAALFAVIGTTYGVGDGSTTFNTPNFASKFPRGVTPGATGGSDNAINVSHTHTFTGSVMGTHGHGDSLAFSGNALGNHTHTFTGSVLGNHGHADTFAFSGNLMGTHGHGDNFTTANQSASHYHTHDHPARTSGIQSASHTHTFTGVFHMDHMHSNSNQSASHKHTFTGSVMGAHNHTATYGYADEPGGSSWGYRSNASSGDTQLVEAASAGTPAGTLGWQSASHTHTISLGGGHQDAGTNANQSASHTHSTNLPSINSGNQSASHNHTINGAVTAASAGTPAGSVTGSVTAGSAGTPAGTNSNESAGTPSGSITGSVTSASAGTPSGTNSTEGASGTNANIPAYLGVNFIIKY